MVIGLGKANGCWLRTGGAIEILADISTNLFISGRHQIILQQSILALSYLVLVGGLGILMLPLLLSSIKLKSADELLRQKSKSQIHHSLVNGP